MARDVPEHPGRGFVVEDPCPTKGGKFPHLYTLAMWYPWQRWKRGTGNWGRDVKRPGILWIWRLAPKLLPRALIPSRRALRGLCGRLRSGCLGLRRFPGKSTPKSRHTAKININRVKVVLWFLPLMQAGEEFSFARCGARFSKTVEHLSIT